MICTNSGYLSLYFYEKSFPSVAPDIYRVGRQFLLPNTPYPQRFDALQRHFDLVALSKLGTFTPGMFFNILYSLYSTIIENEITFQKRDSPFQIQNYSDNKYIKNYSVKLKKG